jgi:hypothetical protein
LGRFFELKAGGKEIDLELPVRDGVFINGDVDAVLMSRSTNDIPQYKPQYWSKVQYFNVNGNKLDPNYHCMPLGVPRLGPPVKIVQLPTETIFFYQTAFQTRPEFRIVRTDGRPHNPLNLIDGSWNGDAIGRWDGDNFVVETEGLDEDTWLGESGYLHSDKTRVIETFHRHGNLLDYDVTVDDPTVLARPWVMSRRTLRANLNTTTLDPTADGMEVCVEYDSAHIIGPER